MSLHKLCLITLLVLSFFPIKPTAARAEGERHTIAELERMAAAEASNEAIEAMCGPSKEHQAALYQKTAHYVYSLVSNELKESGIALSNTPSPAFLPRKLITDPFVINFRIASGALLKMSVCAAEIDFLHGGCEPIRIKAETDAEGNIVKCAAVLGAQRHAYASGVVSIHPIPGLGSVMVSDIVDSRTGVTVLKSPSKIRIHNLILEEYSPR